MNKIFNKSTHSFWVLFILSVFVRAMFIIIYGKTGFDYFPQDSNEYGELMQRTLSGNFNFDLGRFVRAPFYPLLMAGFKLVFKEKGWQPALITFQVFLSSSVTVYLYLIAQQIFKNRIVSFLTGLLSSIYLPAFYYTGAFTTETVYLFFSVSGTYYMLQYQSNMKFEYILIASVIFALGFLTRPEILIYIPFLIFSCWYDNRYEIRSTLIATCIIFLTMFSLSLPWGIINLTIHNTYIPSSNGAKCAFYVGNSQIGYVDAVEVPPRDSEEYKKSRTGFSEMAGPVYDSIVALPQVAKQNAFLKESLRWICLYPEKWIRIKTMYALKFFIPGVSWHHYSITSWLVCFLISLPVYLFAFAGIWLVIKHESFSNHIWFFGKLFSSFVYLVVFIFIQRYRVYSIEAFYLIYAAWGIFNVLPFLNEKLNFSKSFQKL